MTRIISCLVVAMLSTALPSPATAQTQKLSPDYLVGTWRIDGRTDCVSHYTRSSLSYGDRKEADYTIAPGSKIVSIRERPRGGSAFLHEV